MSAALKISEEFAAQATSQNLGEAASAIYAIINKCANPFDLDEQGRLIWRAYGEGNVSEAEASFLSMCLVNRRSAGRARAPGPAAPLGRFAGRVYSRFTSRQRQQSPDRKASRDRRRMLGGSSTLPPDLRHHYTEGQRAVLCVVAGEIKHHGICDLPIDRIAAVAGVCRTSVQTTMHEARRLGHIAITERPQRGRRSLTNVVEIILPEWRAWVRRGPPLGSNFLNLVSTTKNTERKRASDEGERKGEATDPPIICSETEPALRRGSKPARRIPCATQPP
jgi:hypothetical protein